MRCGRFVELAFIYATAENLHSRIIIDVDLGKYYTIYFVCCGRLVFASSNFLGRLA